MLLYHPTRDMPAIYFLSEGKKTTQDKCIHIQSLLAKFGPSMCQQILVLHAFGGSDTTSAIYGHGKGTLFNSLATNCRLSCFVNDLQNQEATQEQVGKAGLKLFHQTVCPISDMRHIAIWCQNP